MPSTQNIAHSKHQKKNQKHKNEKKVIGTIFSIFYSVRHQNPFIILSVIRKICLLFCHWYGEDNKKKNYKQQMYKNLVTRQHIKKMSPNMNATETR